MLDTDGSTTLGEVMCTALATPQKYNNGAWAHATAREHLKALGVDVP